MNRRLSAAVVSGAMLVPAAGAASGAGAAIKASNGIVHVINGVLLPPSWSSPRCGRRARRALGGGPGVDVWVPDA